MRMTAAGGRGGLSDARRIVLACAQIALQEQAWCRTPETWTAPRASANQQFNSLVSHLLDTYPVPTFLKRVWFLQEHAEWQHALYLHLARGHSVRSFSWPVPVRLSKAAARLFMQAPDDLCPLDAVVWSHVRSLGGGQRLARWLMSPNSWNMLAADVDFWLTAVRFLIREAPISDDEVTRIIDFIHDHRFRPARITWGPEAGEEPLDANFSLHGRTLRSLRRYMVNWRLERMAELSLLGPAGSTWQPTAIRPLLWQDGESVWSIEELLSDRELRIEGGTMQHCVATYIRECARRDTSIWSMREQTRETLRRVLTIEVLPRSRVICQAKGRRNAWPTEPAMRVMERWARRERLTIGPGVTFVAAHSRVECGA
jgi:hypothetical protein